MLSCSRAVCFVSLTVTQSLSVLSSSLHRAPLALVSNRSAKEFRPATYKPSDLRQVTDPPYLEFSDSDVHPAQLQGASNLPPLRAPGRVPLLINIREAF